MVMPGMSHADWMFITDVGTRERAGQLTEHEADELVIQRAGGAVQLLTGLALAEKFQLHDQERIAHVRAWVLRYLERREALARRSAA